jgi:hypothetical protein
MVAAPTGPRPWRPVSPVVTSATAALMIAATSRISAVSSASRISRRRISCAQRRAGLGGSDERRCGQPRDLGLVAGQQAVQLGVGAVGQRGPLGDQLSAVVGQRPQVSGLTDRQPYRRQVRLAGGDPGDRDRINRIGLARTRPTGALSAGHAGQADSEPQLRGGSAQKADRLSREHSNGCSNATGVQRRSPPERLVELICRLTLLGGTDVAVDARGDGVGRVAPGGGWPIRGRAPTCGPGGRGVDRDGVAGNDESAGWP